MQEAQIVPRGLLVAREDPAVVLDSAEEALNQMALLVGEPVALPLFLAVLSGRDDRRHAPRQDGLDKFVAVVALVRPQRLSPRRGQRQQGFRLADVAGRPARQDEVERVAQGVDEGMDLGAEPAPRATQRLGVAARRPCGTARMQRLEDPEPAPAGESLEPGVPAAMLGRQ
jgi:hypothetical protein